MWYGGPLGYGSLIWALAFLVLLTAITVVILYPMLIPVSIGIVVLAAIVIFFLRRSAGDESCLGDEEEIPLLTWDELEQAQNNQE